MLTKRSVCACVRIFWQMTFLPSWTHAVLSTSLVDRCYFHVRTCCYCCVHSKGCPETHHPLSPQERGRIRSGWGRLLFIVTNNSFFTSPWLHLLTLSLSLTHTLHLTLTFYLALSQGCDWEELSLLAAYYLYSSLFTDWTYDAGGRRRRRCVIINRTHSGEETITQSVSENTFCSFLL